MLLPGEVTYDQVYDFATLWLHAGFKRSNQAILVTG